MVWQEPSNTSTELSSYKNRLAFYTASLFVFLWIRSKSISRHDERDFTFMHFFVSFFMQRVSEVDEKWFFLPVFVSVSACDMPNAFDRIVESGQEKRKRFFMAFYYTSDKLRFFVTRAWARCHFSDAHFIIYCNLYVGEFHPHT